MPARTGEEYVTGLREHTAEAYICGEQVKDVTTHPAFRHGGRIDTLPITAEKVLHALSVAG